MFQRLCSLSKSNSFFLFGARATGKSTLLNLFFEKKKNVLVLDLLDPATEQELSINPGRLIDKIDALKKSPTWVFIDEVQKIPKLLDIVHKLIFEKKIKFALTGSSARKLKRGNANLLAGRAFSFKLHPLSFTEVGATFDLTLCLRWGSLPEMFFFKTNIDRKRYLQSYVQNYIKEEILVEQLVRNIEPFRAFLEVAAQSNTEIINFARLAREARIDSKNVERYFSILEDTLLGFFLEPYSKSVRKRQIQSPKFYFFDVGVTRALAGHLDSLPLPKTYNYGKTFEHLIILEFIRLNDYLEKGYKFSYLRTLAGVEVDLVIERANKKTILVEIKSTDNVIDDDLASLLSLGSEISNSDKYILCQEKNPRKTKNVKIFPWQEGIKDIFGIL